MTMFQPKGRKPGVYLSIPNDDYHADPAISSTGIKQLLRSPAEYWWNSPLNIHRESEPETPAKKFGQAYHTMILEPQKFQYEVLKGQKSTTKAGCLGEEEYERIVDMAESINRVPEHAQLFKNGYPEVSVFWRDEETGLMCKVRFDYMRLKWITDLKTSDDIYQSSVRYDFPRWGYDVSGAMYMEGSRQLKRLLNSNSCVISSGSFPSIDFANFLDQYRHVDGERFVFMFQGKKSPYLARALAMLDDVAAVGCEKFRRGLTIYAENITVHGANTPWPSGFPIIEDLSLEDLSPSINYY